MSVCWCLCSDFHHDVLSKNNTPKVFFDDAAEMLETVGPLSTLPMLLACLGAVFTSAGAGEIISNFVS